MIMCIYGWCLCLVGRTRLLHIKIHCLTYTVDYDVLFNKGFVLSDFVIC